MIECEYFGCLVLACEPVESRNMELYVAVY